MHIRQFNWLLAALLAVFSGACGSGASQPTAASPLDTAGLPASHPAPDAVELVASPLPLKLPSPLELITSSHNGKTGSTPPVYKLYGQDADPALPSQGALPAAHRMQFLPQWSLDGRERDRLAYALYRFDLRGYSAEKSLTLHWRRIGELADCFIALADFQLNRWRFYPGTDGTLTMPEAQWQTARHPATSELFAVVILTGQRQWELTSIELGKSELEITSVARGYGGKTIKPVEAWPNEHFQLYATLASLYEPGSQWEWDYGEGAVETEHRRDESTLRCSGPGSYPCRVTLECDAGETEASFMLIVRELLPPLITAVNNYHPGGMPGASAPGAASTVASGGYQGEGQRVVVVNTGGPIDTFSWNFGAAAVPQLSTATDPWLVWNKPGTHTARVTATNAAGSHSFEFVLSVEPLRPPLLTDSVFWAYVQSPQELAATNSGGPVESWNWQLGPNFSPETSTESSPVVTGLLRGSQECSVTATNAAGSSTLDFTFYIVSDKNPQLTGVQITPQPVSAGQPVSFLPQGEDLDYVSWEWDFGGACEPNTSTDFNPQVTALNAGSYLCSVTLTTEATNFFSFFMLEVEE